MEGGDLKNAQEAANFIKSKLSMFPKIGIICGSGLSKIGEKVSESVTLNYSDIPAFPHAMVVGHRKELVCGKLGGKTVLCFRGRFHPYQGYSDDQVALPIRVMKFLGIEVVIITNAAGGINEQYNPGDFMLIKDHISFPALSGSNPLRGPNDDSLGVRFPSLLDAYNKSMRNLLKECACDMKLQNIFHEGIYCMIGGPSYETPAETRMLKIVGADAVGMSTVHEVIAACHCGIKVLACSLISDKAILENDSDATVSHEAVLKVCEQRAITMEDLITKFIEKLEV